MLPNRALAAYANALKSVDMTDVGGSIFSRLPETPWEEKHHDRGRKDVTMNTEVRNVDE